jgi:hypothetical protein
MKTHDKHFAIIAAIAGTVVIIAAIAFHAWFHIATGCALLAIYRAYNNESKRSI